MHRLHLRLRLQQRVKKLKCKYRPIPTILSSRKGRLPSPKEQQAIVRSKSTTSHRPNMRRHTLTSKQQRLTHRHLLPNHTQHIVTKRKYRQTQPQSNRNQQQNMRNSLHRQVQRNPTSLPSHKNHNQQTRTLLITRRRTVDQTDHRQVLTTVLSTYLLSLLNKYAPLAILTILNNYGSNNSGKSSKNIAKDIAANRIHSNVAVTRAGT